METNDARKTYKSTRTMVYSCQYHVIWCPKYRRKALTDVQSRLKELILSKQEEPDFEVLEMETMSDHAHCLLDVCPRIGIDKAAGRLKGYTSSVPREEFPELKKRLPSLWTRSKFISAVGSVSLEAVKNYIEGQKGV